MLKISVNLKFYTCLHIVMILIFSTVITTYVESSEGEQEFVWGVGQKPSDAQSAIVGLSYPKSQMKVLPLQEIDSDDDQYGILAIPVPADPPIDFSIYRSSRMVQFDLLDQSVLAYAVNQLTEAVFSDEVEENQKIISPIAINDPNYMGRGVLFSLFRSTIQNEDKTAGGCISVGTAFLVSPSCLVTAAHNVVLNHFKRNRESYYHLNPYAERVEFWPLMNGFNTDMFNEQKLIDGGKRIVSVKIPQQWDTQGGLCENHDVAVLKLQEAIGKDYGWVQPVNSINCHENDSMQVTGYPIRPEIGDVPCLLTKCEGSLKKLQKKIFYDITPLTKTGHSGSPVSIDAVEDSIPKIIGTHTTGKSLNNAFPGGIAFDQEKFDLLGEWVSTFESS